MSRDRRSWIRRAGDSPAECARILVLLVAAIAVMRPFFNDRYVGGSDMRWYAFVLQDFLDQMRAGHFPVFIGQGPYLWSGAVHPFRSAPVYLYLAGAWDLLTFRTLGVYALQHLTVITCAVVGALGFYAAGVALAPRRRWEAMLLALLYVGSPAWLGALDCTDAYLTFMALAALPLVLYGNARSLLTMDGGGYGAIAAGLALTWMCHPPVALLTTLVTLLLQGGGFLLGAPSVHAWKGAARGALLFAGLGAYYFAGMSELPKLGLGSPVLAALQFGGLALVLTGGVNALLRDRGLSWLTLLAPGGWMLWVSCRAWIWWLALTMLLVAMIAAAARAFHRDPARRVADILLPCLLIAAVLVQAWLGPRTELNGNNLQSFADSVAAMGQFFPFVPGRALAPGVDLELGAGIWLVLALLFFAVFRSRALAPRLALFVSVLFLATVIRVPWLSVFLVGYFPWYPASILSFPILLRMLPVMTAFVLMGGVIWLAVAGPERRSHRALGLAVLGVAAGLGALQAARFSGYGPQIIASPAMSLRPFYPENFVLDRFAYDLLPMPEYASNGPTDPRLEFRLLDEKQDPATSPDLIARQMEAAGSTRLRLQAVQDPTARNWLNLEPGLTLAPSQQVLLRFEFDPARRYGGVLILHSEHGYREYQLPNDGKTWGFGTGPERSRVISLGNSQATPEHYQMTETPTSADPGVEGLFATMIVSRYDAERNPVRLESWDPLRVTARADRPAWLETPRVFLPGYVATVDGRAAAPGPSLQHLVMIPLAPGTHVVELRYRGTGRIWLAALVSLATWIAWLGTRFRRPGELGPDPSGGGRL